MQIVIKLLIFIGRKIYFVRGVITFLKFRYFEFEPRTDDIFIVTFPRSGTTLMQMILYQLTSEGNMNFDHISQVSPWFERSAMRGKKIENCPSPRIFKSHLPYKWIPKSSCKYIYVVRNVKDVAVSNFHFSSSHLGNKKTKTFSEFFDNFMKKKPLRGVAWFSHVNGWWIHKDKKNILVLHYEDLVQELEVCLHEIADFCGLDIPQERFPEILEKCSFAFMKKYESKFDHATERFLDFGFIQNSFIRKGKVNQSHDYFTEEHEKILEEQFNKYRELRF